MKLSSIPSLILISFCIFFNSVTAGSKKDLIITENGVTTYSIIVSSNQSENEIFAASLLQKYLQKISGARLPVLKDLARRSQKEILVGFSNRTTGKEYDAIKSTLAPDGFRIYTQGKQLIILGGSNKGCIYGVVELLESVLGCRKYSPSVEYVPINSTIAVEPFLISDQPVNSFRVVNGKFNQDKEYNAWQRLDRIDDRFADGFYVHTFGKLIPREEYFETHPEYFAFLNGKRVNDQPCLTSPDVLRIAVERLRDEMAKQPDRKVWSVSQNDNYTYCHCPECKKVVEEEGAPSGLVIRFVNQVAAQFPDKIISTLAYQFSRQAPLKARPLSNVQVMLCSIELNRAQAISNDLSSRQFIKDIDEWKKICNNIYLWDYTVNFANHISPFPNLHVLQPNIRLFVNKGIDQHFQQTNTDAGHEFSELKSYLISRLLWDPFIDADSVINEFLAGYYGKGATYIRDYINLLQSEYSRSGQTLDIYGSPVWNSNSALSAENVAVYNYLFDKAENAVADDHELVKRVRTARLPLQFAIMEIGKNDMFGPRGWYTDINGKYMLRPKMKATLESFNATCKAAGVRTLSESGLNPEEYYKSTLRFIDVRTDNNLAFRKKVQATPLPASKYSNGDLSILTNGVQGANDYKVHWLGWEAKDFQLTLDLEALTSPKAVKLASLYDPKSWILHPKSVQCEVSSDGKSWKESGVIRIEGDQKNEEVTRTFSFTNNLENIRFVRFSILGTRSLPIWHPSAGGDSWVFLDEIIVE
jgi:hypothetical protein